MLKYNIPRMVIHVMLIQYMYIEIKCDVYVPYMNDMCFLTFLTSLLFVVDDVDDIAVVFFVLFFVVLFF